MFIDEGLLKELVRYFGDGSRIKFDKFDFAKRIAKKRGLFCKHLFYYTCPPFQSDRPTFDEARRKKGHDKFVNSLSKKDLEEFVECYCAGDRSERKESERFKSFNYEEILKRDKTNLDIFWLKDESLEDLDNLPDPDVIAGELVEELGAALEQLKEIQGDLE